MDWILDHLQIIIAVAGAIAYWLNARSKEKAGEEADYDGDGVPDSPLRRKEEPAHPAERIDYDENMRRLREEIQRKIAERQGHPAGQAIPPLPRAVPPVLPDWQRQQSEERRAETERESAVVLERQRALAEQLAELKARRSAASHAANEATWATQPAAVAREVGQQAGDDIHWLRELRNARSLRKAIVLREVLGTPAGLR